VPAIAIDNNGLQLTTTKKTFTAIPYYAWANRGKGEMTVWFPVRIKEVEIWPGK